MGQDIDSKSANKGFSISSRIIKYEWFSSEMRVIFMKNCRFFDVVLTPICDLFQSGLQSGKAIDDSRPGRFPGKMPFLQMPKRIRGDYSHERQ
jgi:hypothetical protein